MLALLWTLQVIDHGGRDFTLDGWHALRGRHEDVRIVTVTRSGEVEPDGAAVEIMARAVVIDGVVSGGPQPVTLAGGGLAAGRHPVLLAPPDGSEGTSPLTFEWYPASSSGGLVYELVIVDAEGKEIRLAPTKKTSTVWDTAGDGPQTWWVEAVASGDRHESEAWLVSLGGTANHPPPAPSTPDQDPDDGSPFFGTGSGSMRSCSAQGAGGMPTGDSLWGSLGLACLMALMGVPRREASRRAFVRVLDTPRTCGGS